jgi:hypothetical protein
MAEEMSEAIRENGAMGGIEYIIVNERVNFYLNDSSNRTSF